MALAAVRGGLSAALLLWAQLAAGVAGNACTCATAREKNLWCPIHKVGYVGGLTITSPWLHEAVDAHGHDVDVSTFTCASCKHAIATDGFCGEHRIGFVGGKAYFSRLTWHLGRGTVRHPEEISCRACRKNSDTHGWCERCGVGMVGLVSIRDRGEYDEAVHDLGILKVANDEARRCEYCAVAIITDTECPVCRIAYKDGKRVASREPHD